MTDQMPVTLILGSHSLGGQFADALKDIKSQRCFLGPSAEIRAPGDPIPPWLHDHATFVSVFQNAINVGGGIDNLILNFTPPPTAHGPDYIPGTDQSATDNVLKPLMKAVKIAFYHWRRDERKTKKRLVILVAEGYDIDTMTSRNAVLGFWRSITIRAEVLGVQPELIVSDLRDRKNNDAIISLFLTSPSTGPTLHIVANGKITSQSQWVGQCQSSAIIALGGRLGPIIWLTEKFTAIGIGFQRLLQPSEPNTIAAILRLLPAVVMTALAAVSYRAQMPFVSLICSAIASRISTVSGAFLLALIAYQATTGRVTA